MGSEGSVLIVDDDPSLLRTLEVVFTTRDFEVLTAPTARAALDLAVDGDPDVVLLDLGLPDRDGLDVCRLLRPLTSARIVVLSADGSEDRKIAALELGADDYVVKPFSTPELLARVRVAIRNRRALAAVVDRASIEVGDLRVDLKAHQAFAAGRELELTRKEFSLLTVLARNHGTVLEHRRLLDLVWGPAQTLDTLRTHVSHLRRKLDAAHASVRIESEPGVGYRLVP